jgi:CRP/FNR family cyclic AMP-dependent transcriptional regulator
VSYRGFLTGVYRWVTVDSNRPSHGSRVRLLEVEPDLGRFLTAEERVGAERVTVPVLTAGRGRFDLDSRLRDAGAFGAVIVDGVLMHRLVLADHPALRLLGPGDILSRQGEPGGAVAQSTYRTPGELRLALLDDRVLATAQHFPRLFAGLHVRMGEQHQRLAAQLVICQLPRVEERILGMLWLLAETWGHVTPSGTTLPVALTHDALGECIGARRPTVSLALKELADRGALLRQAGGWVLLESLPDTPDPRAPRLPEGAVEVTEGPSVTWGDESPANPSEPWSVALRAMVATLREDHTQSQRDVRQRLAASRRIRERTVALREQVATGKRRRRPAP